MLQAFQPINIVTISTIHTQTYLFQKDSISLRSLLKGECFALVLLLDYQMLMVIKEIIVQPSCKNDVTISPICSAKIFLEQRYVHP